MPKPRRRARNSAGTSERRGVLLKIGGGIAFLIGGGLSLSSSDSFSLVAADRNSTVGVASEGSGIIGLTPRGPVKKNSRDPMVEIANNSPQPVTVTVTLSNCGDGGLYDNDDEADVCSVTFTLDAGFSRVVDIMAAATGTIPYSISISSDGGFSLDSTGSVESQAGNVQGAVRIQAPNKDQDFVADAGDNEFEVKNVDVRDNDGDNDLDRVIFTVRESVTSTVVGEFIEENPPGDRYNPTGNPALAFSPNSGYTITSGTNYDLTVRGEDADGNIASETVEDTASGGGGGGNN